MIKDHKKLFLLNREKENDEEADGWCFMQLIKYFGSKQTPIDSFTDDIICLVWRPYNQR